MSDPNRFTDAALTEPTDDAVPLHLVQRRAEPGTPRWMFKTAPPLAVEMTLDRQRFDRWTLGDLPRNLPPGRYRLAGDSFDSAQAEEAALGWVLGAYRFDAFKTFGPPAQLCWPPRARRDVVRRRARAIVQVRDWINLPPNLLGPAALAAAALDCARDWSARNECIVGDALLDSGFAAIHAVGRAATEPPRLLDLHWGDPAAPLVTLIGKGVCFDSGGLHLKSAHAMATMKNDMAGAAHVLALAEMIVAEPLNLQLRVLIPAVENAVSACALRPSDVIRIGERSVEITNTDAEGRLILADALVAARRETPDLLIDMATLTDCAERTFGPDLPVAFANDEAVLAALCEAARAADDPLWPMPLWHGYREKLDSAVADIVNFPPAGALDAICAALFLHEFAGDAVPWIHIDMTAWNDAPRPGRPVGGDARALLALHRFLEMRYGRRNA